MTKVKICGITNLEDALLSVRFGANALGFNFYALSPRYTPPGIVREIVNSLPAETAKIGVFVNEKLAAIEGIAEIAKLTAIQLHGEETPEFAANVREKIGLPVIKAFRVSPDFKPADVLEYDVDTVLLDAYSQKEHGGTGETFDWKVAEEVKSLVSQMYLAGGLRPDNVGTAIRLVNPYGVDVASGVEREKGKKDPVALEQFIKGAITLSEIYQRDNN